MGAPRLDHFVHQQPLLSLWFLASFAVWLTGRDRQTTSRVPNAFAIGEVLCALR
ncbi:MAG TPA: hypothetical protein VFS67_34120 [Polyangiaceae bacterium]|jgi:hypothetical protein|nr:hypothetical protein [Polyangiaceae bacterium]